MTEQLPAPARPETSAGSGAFTVPRTTSAELPGAAAGRDEATRAILVRADLRDQAAQRRDRRAGRHFGVTSAGQAGIDRDWAARDRDAAATDRADLIALARARRGLIPAVDIEPPLAARHGPD